MTTRKDLKRVIRARMLKTGESYTAARMHIVKPDYATLAGMSDAAIRKGTGSDWTRWVKTLDNRGAATMPHREIAKLARQYGAGSWWAQTVAVGYERIRGLRARTQSRSGTWNATKSKTFAVPVAKLFEAWSDRAKRKRWLPEEITIRKAIEPKSMRVTWADGTIIAVGFVDKGAKSAVAVDHAGLKTKADADRIKAFWSDRFAALAACIG